MTPAPLKINVVQITMVVEMLLKCIAHVHVA